LFTGIDDMNLTDMLLFVTIPAPHRHIWTDAQVKGYPTHQD